MEGMIENGAFFRMKKINKYYQMGEEQAHILKDIDLEIEEGEFVAIVGKSGSRKINSFKYYFLFR